MGQEMKINWSIILVAAITATPATIAASCSALKSNAALEKSTETHLLVNSRMTELLEITKKAATADATLKEKELEQARKDSGVK